MSLPEDVTTGQGARSTSRHPTGTAPDGAPPQSTPSNQGVAGVSDQVVFSLYYYFFPATVNGH